MKKYFLVLVVATISFSGFSQVKPTDPGFAALKNCINAYLKLKKFSIDVEYSVFFNHTDFSKPDDRKSGKIIRLNENFYQEEIGNIKVLNKDYEFFLSQEAEVMSLRKRGEKEFVPVQFDLDSLTNKITSIEKITEGYQFTLEEGVLEKFDIVLTSGGLLKCMRNYYREEMDFGNGNQKVITQVKYFNFLKNPDIDNNLFSLAEFIVFSKDGSVTLTSKYKNYYLINNIQN